MAASGVPVAAAGLLDWLLARCWLARCLAGWLAAAGLLLDCWMDCLADWLLAAWLPAWLAGWLAGCR